jgi:hypothetical protein
MPIREEVNGKKGNKLHKKRVIETTGRAVGSISPLFGEIKHLDFH